MWLLLACSPASPPAAAPPAASPPAATSPTAPNVPAEVDPELLPPRPPPAVTARLAAVPPVPGDQRVAVTAGIVTGDQAVPLGWTTLLVEGVAYGDVPFGTVLSSRGAPVKIDGRATCAGPDITGVFPTSTGARLLTHLECVPAAVVQSEITQVEGGWTVKHAAPVSVAAVGGLSNLCSGAATPWGTLLSGEEYETDAGILVNGAFPKHPAGMEGTGAYQDWSELGARRVAEPGSPVWRSGMMIETRPGDGATPATVVRHPAMGRFSHELGAIMPDQRTVYLTDDNLYGGFFLFIADKPGDLSSGRLYAARVEGGDDWTIHWIDLGAATDAAVSKAADADVPFASLFTRTPLPCAPGTTPHRAPQGIDECLALAPGADPVIASRLDSRRYAAIRGATLEIEKSEGLALDEAGSRLFVALTRVKHGLLAADPPPSTGIHDDLAMTPNPCGVVMDLALGPGVIDTDQHPIPSEWVAQRGRVAVAGKPEGDGCAKDGISNPDNLAWAPSLGSLLIAEDTDRSPNRLWAWDGTALLPLFSAPEDAAPGEVSGLSWVPDLGGSSYITVSVQRPGTSPAFVGLLGPFPR